MGALDASRRVLGRAAAVACMAMSPLLAASEPLGGPRAAPADAVAAWPAAGVIEYEVLYGKLGFRIGNAIHRWTREGNSYRMESVAKAGKNDRIASPDPVLTPGG